ncbi:hypothetical protein CK216_29585 [Mesorhizobium sp. WSM3876]|nr:hypothetical protein CK216_29585 [Mesorhizobium sp. WSM3876]
MHVAAWSGGSFAEWLLEEADWTTHNIIVIGRFAVDIKPPLRNIRAGMKLVFEEMELHDVQRQSQQHVTSAVHAERAPASDTVA